MNRNGELWPALHDPWGGVMNRISFVAAIVGVLVLTVSAMPAVAGPYGALATSPDADFGFSYNYDDRESARRRAMQECRKHSSRCQVKGVFENTCVAIVTASNGAMGWAWGRSRSEDTRVALRECRDNRGRNCKFARRFCTGDADDD